ncbi:MAG: N-acetyl-gamma-glutamyl-phosphate reductase [Christensenellales bacterium]|jgi:N-acetyl-gamma-glutamyl-phosphate reductase
MYRVFIDGKVGTTGLRISERMHARGDVELITLPDEQRKDSFARRTCINSSDVTFLCLPDDAAREAARMADPFVRVIDASTAHRTQQGWSYGLPELSSAHAQAVQNSFRVAVPGCHASGFAALIYPLVHHGILDSAAPLTCFSLTGYSGGGRAMIAQYEDPQRSESFDAPRQYALSGHHKHLAEMQATSGLSLAPALYPVVAGYYSGMVVSVPLHERFLTQKLGRTALYELYKSHYAKAKLIEVLSEADGLGDGFLSANVLAGRDIMQLAVTGTDDRPMLTARFDNLGKGASGAAVQCMNLMLGLDETLGLQL